MPRIEGHANLARTAQMIRKAKSAGMNSAGLGSSRSVPLGVSASATLGVSRIGVTAATRASHACPFVFLYMEFLQLMRLVVIKVVHLLYCKNR